MGQVSVSTSGYKMWVGLVLTLVDTKCGKNMLLGQLSVDELGGRVTLFMPLSEDTRQTNHCSY